MGDNYYDRQGGYPASRDSYAQQDSRSSAYTAYPQTPSYNTYQSPVDEGYRPSPVPQNLQVTQYDDDRSRQRRSGDYNARPRSRHGDDYYDEDRYSDRGHLPPPSPNSHRPSSRGSHKEKDRKSEVQSIGATILGGVAGALIGRKAGKKDILPTVLGGVAGAWGGHKLEEEFTERKGEGHGLRSRSKSRDRGEIAYGGRGRDRRRSDESDETDRKSFKEKVKDRIRSLSRKRGDERSRSRGDSRRRRDGSADSYDDRRDRRQSGRHDYESESRDHYDRDDRYDRDRERERNRY